MDTPTFLSQNAEKVKQVSGHWFEAIHDPDPQIREFFEETKDAGLEFAISGHQPYEAKIGEDIIYMRYVGD